MELSVGVIYDDDDDGSDGGDMLVKYETGENMAVHNMRI